MAGKERRRKMRELADIAYQRELDGALSELEGKFRLWRSGEISCHELSDLIHEFHNGAARDIWSRYARLKPHQTVPIAVAEGILAEGELPAELLAELRPAIQSWARLSAEEADPEEAEGG